MRALTAQETDALTRLLTLANDPNYAGESADFFTCSECGYVNQAPEEAWNALSEVLQDHLRARARQEHLKDCSHRESVYQPDPSGKHGLEGKLLAAMQQLGREPHISRVCAYGKIPFRTVGELLEVQNAINNLLKTGWLVKGTRLHNSFRLASNI